GGAERPRPLAERRRRAPRPYHGGAETQARARPPPIDQAAEHRAESPGDQEPERECAGGEPARPAELVEDRRKQQRENRARVDADAHRDERDGTDDPAEEHGA